MAFDLGNSFVSEAPASQNSHSAPPIFQTFSQIGLPLSCAMAVGLDCWTIAIHSTSSAISVTASFYFDSNFHRLASRSIYYLEMSPAQYLFSCYFRAYDYCKHRNEEVYLADVIELQHSGKTVLLGCLG